MLTVFYGNDSLSSRQKMAKALDGEEGNLLRFDEITITKDAFLDSIGSQGLFGGKTIVILDSVLQSPEAAEYVSGSYKNMNTSPNSFYILAGSLDAQSVKSLEKSGGVLVKSDTASAKTREMPGSFALADAFVRRDKKTAWMLFTKLLLDDVSPQEMCGTLVWQMRILVLAYTTHSADEAGVSEYPYKKAKSSLKYYSQREAETVLRKLLGIYHFDPALNRGNTAGALERLILSL